MGRLVLRSMPLYVAIGPVAMGDGLHWVRSLPFANVKVHEWMDDRAAKQIENPRCEVPPRDQVLASVNPDQGEILRIPATLELSQGCVLAREPSRRTSDTVHRSNQAAARAGRRNGVSDGPKCRSVTQCRSQRRRRPE